MSAIPDKAEEGVDFEILFRETGHLCYSVQHLDLSTYDSHQIKQQADDSVLFFIFAL